MVLRPQQLLSLYFIVMYIGYTRSVHSYVFRTLVLGYMIYVCAAKAAVLVFHSA